MSSDTTTQVGTVAVVVLILLSSVPPTVIAGTGPADAPAPSASDSDSHLANGDSIVRSSTASPETSPSELTSPSTNPQGPAGAFAAALSSSSQFYAQSLQTAPNLQNLQVQTTAVNNSNGRVRLKVTVTAKIPEDNYPRNYPIRLDIAENGVTRLSETIHLSPDASPNYEAQNTLRRVVYADLSFSQDGTTTRSLDVTATSQLDGDTTTVTWGPTDVYGASEDQSATFGGLVVDSQVNEPPAEVSFVSRYRASEPTTDPAYQEDFGIPLSDLAHGDIKAFPDMRQVNDKAATITSVDNKMVVGTSTTNIPNGSTQTLVVAYQAVSGHDIDVTPLTAQGDPLHPQRSTSYTLAADPSTSPNCQTGEKYDLCVFTLSETERDAINNNHELYVEYSTNRSSKVMVFCQAVITGVLKPGQTVCGHKGSSGVGDYATGDVFNATGREHGTSEPWTHEVNVSTNSSIDANVSLLNTGSTAYSGTLHIYPEQNFSYRKTDYVNWSVGGNPAGNPDNFDQTGTLSSVFEPREVTVTLRDVELNGHTVEITVKNGAGESTTRQVDGSDVTDDVIRLGNFDNTLSTPSDTYTVSMEVLDNSSVYPSVGSVRVTGTEAIQDAGAGVTRDVTLSSQSMETVYEYDLPTWNETGTFYYVALLCADGTAICDPQNNAGYGRIKVNVGFGASEEAPPYPDTGGPYVVSLPQVSTDKTRDGYITKQLANKPTGTGWKKVQKVGTTTGIQTETVAVENVSIASTPVSSYEDEARAKLSDAPGDKGWSLTGMPELHQSYSETEIAATRPIGDGWVRSSEPVSTAETGDWTREWVNVSSGEGNSSVMSGGSQAEYNLNVQTTSDKWVKVRDEYGNVKTRTINITKETLIQHEDPDKCRNCFKAETLEQRKNRTGEVEQTSGNVSHWEKSDTDTVAEVLTVEVSENRTYSYGRPGPQWQKVDENPFPQRDLWRKPVYDRLEIYRWEKQVPQQQVLIKRPNTEDLYKWEQVKYDLSYTFETDTGDQTVYEWRKPTYNTVPVYGSQTIWFNASESFDRPSHSASGIAQFKWTFGNGESTGWLNWDADVQTQPLSQRSCNNADQEVQTNRFGVQGGTAIVQTCYNQTSGESYALRVGQTFDSSGEYHPRLKMQDYAGNMNTSTATITVRNGGGWSGSVKPSLSITNYSDRVDYKYGKATFTVKLSAESDNLRIPWEVAITPADKFQTTDTCPAGYTRKPNSVILSETDISQTEQRREDCVRDDPLSDTPNGTPAPPNSFKLKQGPIGEPYTYYDIDAGAVRECPADWTPYTDTVGSTTLFGCEQNGEQFIYAEDDGTGREYQNVSGGYLKYCPSGYMANRKTLKANETASGKQEVRVDCERIEVYNYTLRSKNIEWQYQSVDGEKLQACPDGYTKSGTRPNIDCIQDTSSDPGTNEFSLMSNYEWEAIPAGAIRSCPTGWHANRTVRSEKLTCLENGASDDFFVLANLQQTQWVANEPPKQVVSYAPNAEKVVWANDHLSGGEEQVTITINPRRNGVFQPGENKTVTVELRPVGAEASRNSISREVRFCVAKTAQTIPKTTRGPDECPGLDTDYDSLEDWYGNAVYEVPTPDGSMKTVQMSYLNDACPYNPFYPRNPDYIQTKAGSGDMTLEELQGMYGDVDNNRPCVPANGTGAIQPSGSKEVVTWDADDWDAIPSKNISNITHTDRATSDTRGMDYPHQDGLTLGYSLQPDKSVNEGLVAYYPFDEGDKEGPERSSPPDNFTYDWTAFDVWTQNGEAQYNGSFWFRNPCSPDGSLASSEYPSQNQECQSQYFGTLSQEDTNPEDTSADSTTLPRNSTYAGDYLGYIEDLSAVASGGSSDVYIFPEDYRQAGGVYGTRAYRFDGHNWIELSSSHHESQDGNNSPGPDLARRLTGAGQKGGYTISFWYKAKQPVGGSEETLDNYGYPENTLFGIASPHDFAGSDKDYDSVELHHIITNCKNPVITNYSSSSSSVYTESSDCPNGYTYSVGWPRYNMHKEPVKFVQDGRVGFFTRSDTPTATAEETPEWHHIAFVRHAQLAENTSSGYDNAVRLYVDGQLADEFYQAKSWSTMDYGCDGICLLPNYDDSYKANSHGDPNTLFSENTAYNGSCAYDCEYSDHYADKYNGNIWTSLDKPPLGDISPNSRITLGAQWKKETSGHLWWTDATWRTEKGFNGWMDEVRIYDQPLMADEVQNLSPHRGKATSTVKKSDVAAHSKADINLTTELTLPGNDDAAVIKVIPCPGGPGNCQPSNGHREVITASNLSEDSGTLSSPLQDLSLNQGTQHFRLNITLVGGRNASTVPTVHDAQLTVEPPKYYESCQQMLAKNPGMLGSGTSIRRINPDGASQSTPAQCDMTTTGGGWTQFWWYNESQSPDRLLNFTESHTECQPRQAACMGRMNMNWSQNSSLLMKVDLADGTTEFAAWKFSNGGTTGKSAFDAMRNDTANIWSSTCWNAYRWQSDSWSSFGSDSLSCKAQFEYEPLTRIRLFNFSTGETAFDIQQSGSQIDVQALGHSPSEIEEVSFYYRNGGPVKNFSNSTDGSSKYPNRPPNVSAELHPRVCSDVLIYNTDASSGTYTLYPNGPSGGTYNLECDMNTNGGGWTLVMDDQFTNDRNGWNVESVTGKQKNGYLTAGCSQSYMSNYMEKSVNDRGLPYDQVRYDTRGVALDSWDGEQFKFGVWTDGTYQTADYWYPSGGGGENFGSIDCSGYDSAGSYSTVGIFNTTSVDKVRWSNRLNQDNHDESMAVDYAEIGVRDDHIEPNETVYFFANASDPDGDDLSYQWDFDDGTTTLGKHPSHSFDSEGTYTVKVTVTDPAGETANDTFTIDVSKNVHTVGETGTASFNAGSRSDWNTINFQHSYDNPVIIAKPVSYNGGNPAHIRVKDLSSTSAKLKIEEWSYLDGAHTTETVHYMVVEQGSHKLPDGTILEAGVTSTDTAWQTVNFDSSFGSDPALFTQPLTFNGGDPIVTRNSGLSASSFDVKVQEEEAKGGHTTESIGYIAIQQGSGTNNGVSYEAGTSSGVDDTWNNVAFANSYSSSRMFIADMQTYNGGNTAGLRWQNFYSSSVDIKSEEEKSSDDETGHANEMVGYAVFDSSTTIKAESSSYSGTTVSGDGSGTVEKTLIDHQFDSNKDGWSASTYGGRGSHTSDTGSYSLYVHASSGETVTSPSMDGSNAVNVTLSYWLRRGDDGFSEDPDASGEGVDVQYLDSSGNWQTAKSYSGTAGSTGSTWSPTIQLPSDAYHSNLKIRFRHQGGSGSGYDYWHVDNVTVVWEG